MRIGFFGDSLTEGRPGVSYVDILRARFPADEMVNLGRCGDSVIGTHEIVASPKGRGPFDLAFVWAGVNDILAHVTWASPIRRRLMGEPWANSRGEFVTHYRALLETLSENAMRIVAVAPLFIGEDLSNLWNRELEVVAHEIESLCASFDRVEFLNLRPYMPAVASGTCASPFLEKRGLGMVWEVLALRDAADVDRVAAERGLWYTVDGVHLNSRGALAVAEAFAARIHPAEEAAP